jgi:flagellar hook-length control protein FliK
MTFLNSAGLLNMGNADAVKNASSTVSTQDFQANQSDEFAQALRKQLQQANKPASTMVPPADAKNKQPVKENQQAQAAQTNNNVKNEPAPKEQPKTNTATAKDKNADDGKTDQNKEVKDQAATAEDAAGVDETALDRKKRLISNLQATDLQATDPTTAGISPWMQSMTAMIAMRQSSGQNVDEQADISSGVGISLPKGEFVVDPEATAIAQQALADKTLAANIPVDAQPATVQVPAAADAKTPVIADSQTAVTDKPAKFSETLDIAKSVADAAHETAITDKAVAQALNADAQIENTNTVTMPVAQALPNSPWLNTAGISQNANVLMSQVATPFGNERWQTAMNQHVLNMVGSGDDVASLTLSPPDLGPIQVVLKVDNQSVNTSFITDNPLVRQALEDGLQDLRDRMESQGLELGQTFVGNGQQAEQHFEQSAKGSGKPAVATAETESAAVATTAVKTRVVRGLVDTFA